MLILEIVLTLCYLTGIYMQIIRPSCTQIDFDNVNSVDQFEPCEDEDVFVIKSYSDVSVVPFRSNVENHLSNIEAGISCLRTKQIFNLDSNTEIDSLIYLNSDDVGDNSFVDIQAFDTEEGHVYFVGGLSVSNEWTFFNAGFSLSIENAKIEIRAGTTAQALLAIEYLHVVNPAKAEQYCRRTTTTTTTTTTPATPQPTETETEPTETETEPTETETEPTETETEPTETETEPTETETEPTETETEPTETETEPTETETEPTETETEPTETETYPTETESEPTETETEPTETETEPTETETEITETETDETETETEPTETETEPTETDSDPTETETQPTNTDFTDPEAEPTMTDTDGTETNIDNSDSDNGATEADTETPPNQIPVDSNESTVWIILSFTFLLTTIIAAATLIYLIFLYKSAVATTKSLMVSPVAKTALPRLTVASSYGGNQVIIGIENAQNYNRL